MEREGTLNSRDVTLFYHAVTRDHPKAVMILVHGLSEHGGRYRKLQNELAEAGFASWAYDQRGFGQSTGARTDVADYRDFLNDLKNVTSTVREEYPRLPLGLMGHSLGGLVVSTFCIAYPNEADLLVLSAPAYDVFPLPRSLHVAGLLCNILVPKLHIRYPSSGDHLSHDPEIGRAFRKDPMIQSKATPRFYAAFRKMNSHLHQQALQMTVPVLILQGTADAVVVPEGARRLYEAIGSTKKRLIEYDGFYHECFNEIGREQVVSDMIQWLNATLDSPLSPSYNPSAYASSP